jgi:hypothetical protein
MPVPEIVATVPEIVATQLDIQLRDRGAMERVHRAAERYARVERDSLFARELVADVVGDTALGQLTWNPARVPLAIHLIDEVRRRARRMRARDLPVSLDELTESEILAASGSIGDEDPWYPSVADLPDVVRAVRARVAADHTALQLLSLYELGITRMRDVLWAGMPLSAYRAARAALRRSAHDVLRSGADLQGTGTPAEASSSAPSHWGAPTQRAA